MSAHYYIPPTLCHTKSSQNALRNYEHSGSLGGLLWSCEAARIRMPSKLAHSSPNLSIVKGSSVHMLPFVLLPVRQWPWSKYALHDNKSAHHISRKTCCQRTKHLSLFPGPAPSPALHCAVLQWVYLCTWNNSGWTDNHIQNTTNLYLGWASSQGYVCLIKQGMYAFSSGSTSTPEQTRCAGLL